MFTPDQASQGYPKDSAGIQAGRWTYHTEDLTFSPASQSVQPRRPLGRANHFTKKTHKHSAFTLGVSLSNQQTAQRADNEAPNAQNWTMETQARYPYPWNHNEAMMHYPPKRTHRLLTIRELSSFKGTSVPLINTH